MEYIYFLHRSYRKRHPGGEGERRKGSENRFPSIFPTRIFSSLPPSSPFLPSTSAAVVLPEEGDRFNARLSLSSFYFPCSFSPASLRI